MATLTRIPALRVLAELPVPVLAVGHDGTILFANTAFAQMLGYSPGEVRALAFGDVYELPVGDPGDGVDGDGVISVIRGAAGSTVRLIHAEGSTIRAVMSRCTLQQVDERSALMTFEDVSERWWLEGR